MVWNIFSPKNTKVTKSTCPFFRTIFDYQIGHKKLIFHETVQVGTISIRNPKSNQVTTNIFQGTIPVLNSDKQKNNSRFCKYAN